MGTASARRFDAWPFSAEWLSAMFDVNKAPFFQSFVEVAVEPSAGRVRPIPHGIHGRLRWSDLQSSGTVKPAGVPDEAFAEWGVEMPPGAAGLGRLARKGVSAVTSAVEAPFPLCRST